MCRSLFCLLILVCVCAAPAWAINCPIPSVPKVILTTNEDPIEYNLSVNRAGLNQMGANLRTVRNAVGSNPYVGGLTNGTIRSDISTNLQTLSSTDGQGCVWVSNVTIKLSYHPIVYISQEFAPRTCYFDAVNEHEHKHVSVDLDLIAKFAPLLEQGIEAVATQQGHIGPFPMQSMQNNGQQINSAMQAKLDVLMGALSNARQAAQAQVDMPQEYARVQALCKNWP